MTKGSVLLVACTRHVLHGGAEKRLGQLLHDHEVEHVEGRLTHVHGEKSFPQGERSFDHHDRAEAVAERAVNRRRRVLIHHARLQHVKGTAHHL